jgi:hypothetical protein
VLTIAEWDFRKGCQIATCQYHVIANVEGKDAASLSRGCQQLGLVARVWCYAAIAISSGVKAQRWAATAAV